MFWIRVYDLPLGIRNKGKDWSIGKKLRELVVKVDKDLASGGWARFLRSKVKIDITRPLRRVVKIIGAIDKKDI
ncbi:hypothetical protein DITRI_Ditri02bG0155700 [Diplodiscus trichospermus]